MESKVVLSIFIYYNLAIISESLIPNICVHNATTMGICCPTPKWSSQVCGGPHRGHCAVIHHAHELIPEIYKYDDRILWPKRFFHSVCHCKENFFGIACDECWYGWTGPHCDRRSISVRKNMKHLSKHDRKILMRVVDLSMYVMSDYSVYVDKRNRDSDPISPFIKWMPAVVQYMLVFIHRFGSRATLFEDYWDCQNFGIMNFNHESVGFLTWHRYYMLHWERELQKIARKYFGIDNFALPYWDWTDQKSCDICTNDFVGAPGERDRYGVRISSHHPYHNWTEFCMEPSYSDESGCYGCHVAGAYGKITRDWNSFNFPTTEDIEYVLSKRHFAVDGERATDLDCKSFHRALEGLCGQPEKHSNQLFMHNKIHNQMDGSMCCSGSAPNDPIFIYHHIQIDRIFEAYIEKYNPSLSEFPEVRTRPGHSRFSYLTSFLPLVTHAQMFMTSTKLGYVYDNFMFGNDASEPETMDDDDLEVEEYLINFDIREK